jgi:hypothetical protein
MSLALRTQEIAKESIPQLARGGFHADAFLCGVLTHVLAINVKFQVVLASQVRDEFLIGVRVRSAQFVIEMYRREDNAEFVPQLQQQT